MSGHTKTSENRGKDARDRAQAPLAGVAKVGQQSWEGIGSGQGCALLATGSSAGSAAKPSR